MAQPQLTKRKSLLNRALLTSQNPIVKSPAITRRRDSNTATTLEIEGLPISKYVIEKSLGKGVFGEVLLASSIKESKKAALKRIPKDGPKFNWNLVKVEVEAGKRVSGHKHIAKLEEYFETINNIYLVFDYVEGIDLFGLMESRDFFPLEEKETRRLMKQITDSLIFCHNQGVAHRDVKLDNIIVDWSGNTKLIDFGLASIDEETCSDFVGSPEYVAPEIIQQVPHSGYLADVYSLGMVFYCLLFGQFPFVPEYRLQLVSMGLEHPPIEWPDRSANFPTFVSKSAKDLLSKMLEVDPSKRISMHEVVKHKWFSEDQEAPSFDIPQIIVPEGINAC